MASLKTDVLIQGGGPVGGTLALLLAGSNFQVSVVDHLPLEPFKIQDHRGFALSSRSKKILELAGVWSSLEDAVEPILKIQVSNGRQPYYLNFESSDPKIMGYLVDAYRLRQHILEACLNHPHITWYPAAKISHMADTVKAKEIMLTTGKHLEASLGIGADGKNSAVRTLAQISSSQWNYHQSALVVTIQTSLPHHNIAYEKFLPTGPFASLPMTHNRLAIVWAIHPDAAEVLRNLDESLFLEQLSQHLDIPSYHLKMLTQRSCYPLIAQQAESYVASRLALIGDAAHVIHPLAGQGLNLGLQDVGALMHVLKEARRLGLDIGAPSVLYPYSSQRRRAAWVMLHSMNSLNGLFSNHSLVLNRMRGWGLKGFNALPLFKKAALKYGMGEGKF